MVWKEDGGVVKILRTAAGLLSKGSSDVQLVVAGAGER